jgi:peptidoglycan/xylan/chitin deacetylase (PgdA/CDA1 family)
LAEPQSPASGRDTIVLTFDDAFTDFADVAYPILAEHSLPVTVFVPTGLLGQTNEWDRADSSISIKRIMTAAQIRGLSSEQSIDWGSHTVDHVSMRQLSVSDMRHQAHASRLDLEDIVGRAVSLFSYPYGQRGNVSLRAEAILAHSGYRIAVTTFWGTRNSHRRLLRLRRIWLDEHDSLATVRHKIDGRYDWMALKEAAGFGLRSLSGLLQAPRRHCRSGQ